MMARHCIAPSCLALASTVEPPEPLSVVQWGWRPGSEPQAGPLVAWLVGRSSAGSGHAQGAGCWVPATLLDALLLSELHKPP